MIWNIVFLLLGFCAGCFVMYVAACNKVAKLTEKCILYRKERDDANYTLWHRDREKELRPVKPYKREDK